MKFICWKAWCCQPLCPAAEQPPWPNAREQIRDKAQTANTKKINKNMPSQMQDLQFAHSFEDNGGIFEQIPTCPIGGKMWGRSCGSQIG